MRAREGGDVERLGDGTQDGGDFLGNGLADGEFVGAALEPRLGQLVADPRGGARSQVRQDQRVFQLVEPGGIEPGHAPNSNEVAGEVFGEPLGSLGQPSEHARGPAFIAHASKPLSIWVGVIVIKVPGIAPVGSATRAKFSAWPVPSRSASTVWRVPIRPCCQRACPAATAARNSAARARITGNGVCGMRAAGVWARAE